MQVSESVSPKPLIDSDHVLNCKHCGAGFATGTGVGMTYCCAGCESIAGLLASLKLEGFYAYQSQGLPGKSPAKPKGRSYAWLDDPEVQKSFATDQFEDGTCNVVLPLEGIHCAGCLWLLEALPQVVPGIVRSRACVSRGEIEIRYDSSKTTLSAVARTLDSLGYPIKIQKESSSDTAKTRTIFRLGIAGFGAMNTMMLAVSLFQGLYTPIDSSYQSFFQWTSLLLTLPVVTFCALPLYKNSWLALRLKRFHVDQPIALAILAAFFLSVTNTLLGKQQVYYDSLCGLVFFLMLGRFIQENSLNRARRKFSQQISNLPDTTVVITDSGEIEKLSSHVKAGEKIRIDTGWHIPVDAVVLHGTCLCDESLLTGETVPKPKATGDTLWAGTSMVEGFCTAISMGPQAESRLGKILATIRRMDYSDCSFSRFADKASAYFVVITVVVSILAGLFWSLSNTLTGFEVALTVLIVSCPCALGIAIPAALGTLVSSAARNGILISRAGIVDDIPDIAHYVFDKTGTLTDSSPAVVATSTYEKTNSSLSAISYSLASLNPSHPLSRALMVKSESKLHLESPLITPGRGHSAIINGKRFHLGSVQWARELALTIPDEILQQYKEGQSVSLLFDSSKIYASYCFNSCLKPETAVSLVALGKEQWILSGDNQQAVQSCAEKLGIPINRAFGGLSPEEKQKKLSSIPGPCLMVGDGMNDALALKKAQVSIGIRGGLEVTMKLADAYLSKGSLSDLVLLVDGVNNSRNCMLAILIFSALYNAISAAIAVLHLMTPLIAAIIMPLNALFVLALALFWPIFPSVSRNLKVQD